VLTRLTALWSRREVVFALAARDLQSRYKGSILGVAWSLMHPIVLVIVYTIAFRYVIRIPIPHYTLFLVSGLLPWIFVATSLSVASGSIVDQGAIVKKVAFPREALPLAAVLAQFAHFAIAYFIVVPSVAAAEIGLSTALVAVPVVMVLLAIFTCGLALAAASSHVFFRDTRHLLEIGLQVWFWITPIVYSTAHVEERYRRLFDLNPLVPFVAALRTAIVDATPPAPSQVALLLVLALASFGFGYAIFSRGQGRFAEYV